MSNRKAHRRERSVRRSENFVQQRLRRPNRSERFARQIDLRRERRAIKRLIAAWSWLLLEAAPCG